MKKIVILGLLVLLSYNIFSQSIWIENRFNEPLYVCIAYHTSKDGWTGYVSEGWWRVIPGEKKAIVPISKIDFDIIYLYACNNEPSDPSYQLTDREYGEDIYVNMDGPFVIKNCRSDYVAKEHPEYTTVTAWQEAIDIRKSLFSKQKDQTIVLFKGRPTYMVDTIELEVIEPIVPEPIVPIKKKASSKSPKKGTSSSKKTRRK